MNWFPPNPPCDASVLGPLMPERMLIEYEGPRMFTCRHPDGRMLLAYQSDEDGDLWRYTVVPFSERQLDCLTSGRITIGRALDQSWGWIADVRDGAMVESVWEVDPVLLPDDYRPNPDVGLAPAGVATTPTEEPDLSLRLLGHDIGHDHVPLSVIRHAADRTISVVRGLVDFISDSAGSRFTAKESREFADLPVCGVLLASFQLSLQLPKPDDVFGLGVDSNRDHLAREMRRLMGKVVEWSADPELASTVGHSPEEMVAILRAVEELSPSGRTPVQEVRLSGKLVAESHRGPISLSKETRKSARTKVESTLHVMGSSAKESIRWPDLIQATGVISNADTKRLTFYLRDVWPLFFLDRDAPIQEEEWPYGDLILFSFDESWRDFVIQALDTSAQVTVIGKLSKQAEQPEGVILAYSVPQYRLIEVGEE